MNRALPLLAIALSVVALGAAFLPRGEVAPQPALAPEPARPAADAEVDALKRRIELLEDDSRTLWNRVVQLEQRPAGAADSGAEGQGEVARLREELRSVIAGEVLSSEAGRSAVKDLIQEAQAERQRERLDQLEARRAERAEAQQQKWKAFVGTAKLTWAQEQKLNERLALEEAERKKQMERLRLGEQTWREVSQYLAQQRRETDEAMQGLLDQSQQAQYRELRQDDGGRSPRQRGGGGGGARGARDQAP